MHLSPPLHRGENRSLKRSRSLSSSDTRTVPSSEPRACIITLQATLPLAIAPEALAPGSLSSPSQLLFCSLLPPLPCGSPRPPPHRPWSPQLSTSLPPSTGPAQLLPNLPLKLSSGWDPHGDPAYFIQVGSGDLVILSAGAC